jgi:DNA (cytosine-5)-methyltransferase 1
VLPAKMPQNVFMECKKYFNKKSGNSYELIHEIKEKQAVYQSSFQFLKDDIPFPPPKHPEFTFIDLFAGIGGFRLAFQKLGGNCVFSCEWDEQAKKTYELNFGEVPFGDITQFSKKDIPEHDVLCAGFPCQPFSVAGYREGFNDKKGRGNLFFRIAEIIADRKPLSYILENVKNLRTHDHGRTFSIINKTLTDLGYHIKTKVLNTMEYANIPQNRERIFIVGFLNKDMADKFTFPEKIPLTSTIGDFLEKNIEPKYYYNDKPLYSKLKDSVVHTDTIYQWRRKYIRENKNKVCPTLTANMGMGGHNVPIMIDNKGIRKLTPRECANFQ